MVFLELIVSILIVFFLWITGLALYHILAVRIFNYRFPERDSGYFAIGSMVSIPLLGSLLQYFAWLRIYGFWLFIVFWIVFFTFFRSILKDFFLASILRIRNVLRFQSKYDIAKYISILFFLYYSFFIFTQVIIPSTNVDVYVYHFPIAFSLAKHHGFALPLVPHPYYANMPSFVEFLFSMGLLFESDYLVCHVFNFSIFVIFLFSLIGLIKPQKFAYLLLFPVLLVLSDGQFLDTATNGMIDTARACFGVSAILVLIYAGRSKSHLYYFISGVLAGADLGSKYLGLLTIGLLGIIYLGFWIRNQWTLSSFFQFCLLFGLGLFLTASPWYIKNLILFANPIYPYVFAHPGLTDEWMRELMVEQTRAYNPEFRNFQRDLFSTQGWSDVWYVIYAMFFRPIAFFLFAIFLSLGFFLRKNSEMLSVLFLSILYLLIWYFAIFNSSRFAITGYLLLSASFVWAVSLSVKQLFDSRKFLWQFLPFLILFMLPIHNLTRGLLKAAEIPQDYILGKVSRTEFLSRFFPMYGVMKFVVDKQIERLWSPFDYGNQNYIKFLFPETRSATPILSPIDFEVQEQTPCEFSKKYRIEYFTVPSAELSSLEKERLDLWPGYYNRVKWLSDYYKHYSDEIYKDRNDNRIFHVNRDELPCSKK